MRSIIIAAIVAFAAPAWATGERVLLSREAEPFRDSLCVSMTCVSAGPRDAVVTARSLKGGVELTVRSASGQVKLVYLTRFNASGDLSSLEVMRATALAVKAIESTSKNR